MRRSRWVILLSCASVFAFSGLLAGNQDQETPLSVAHGECTYFGPQRDKFVHAALKAVGRGGREHPLTDLTNRFTAMTVPAGGPTYTFTESHQSGSIDSYIWADFQKNKITPAPATTDFEFVRRITLDLTGRIPTPDAVVSFVAGTAPNKRAVLIDSLLNSPAWVDKWTMFYGDLFQNTVTKPSTGINRFPQGRNAFYQYIHDSLASNKPYNQIASDLISTQAENSYNNGPVNFLVGDWISNGPASGQDTWDQMASNIADTFLGLTHVNCLLCHNGRGHLDQISLWGGSVTRYQAWQFASFLSHTQTSRTTIAQNVNYWSLADNTKGFTNDYPLNTTSGNRPARQPPTGCKAGQPCSFVPPQYIFNGASPAAGQNYRAALAGYVTGDMQFARAAVNYVWAQFFGMGIVDPPDTFDLARLDPNNPPPAPWTLQPTNASLLNALAIHFVQSGYDVKALMREIANSQTYQLSSRYNGTWNVAYEPYFARKYVRRLWAEEVVDAISQSSGNIPTYTLSGFTDQGFAAPTYTMQFPDVVNAPTGGTGYSSGNVNDMLNAFIRGNRDDQPRKQEGSILQALSLMNNPVVESRLQYTGSTPAPLIKDNLSKSNTDLINTLFLTILSRYPSAPEMATATAAITSASNRSLAVQNVAWSLYNKVDFVFNY